MPAFRTNQKRLLAFSNTYEKNEYSESHLVHFTTLYLYTAKKVMHQKCKNPQREREKKSALTNRWSATQ